MEKKTKICVCSLGPDHCASCGSKTFGTYVQPGSFPDSVTKPDIAPIQTINYPITWTGWLCPRCGSSNAPFVQICPCSHKTTYSTTCASQAGSEPREHE